MKYNLELNNYDNITAPYSTLSILLINSNPEFNSFGLDSVVDLRPDGISLYYDIHSGAPGWEEYFDKLATSFSRDVYKPVHPKKNLLKLLLKNASKGQQAYLKKVLKYKLRNLGKKVYYI